MVSISINAKGISDVLKKFRKVKSVFANQSRSKINKKIAISMYGVTARNFRDEQGEGKPWAPLSPITIAWKRERGYEKILQNTGILRNSFGHSSTADVAMVFGKSITKKRKEEKEAKPDIAKIHQFGKGRIPARPMLPSKDEILTIASKIYTLEIKRSVR